MKIKLIFYNLFFIALLAILLLSNVFLNISNLDLKYANKSKKKMSGAVIDLQTVESNEIVYAIATSESDSYLEVYYDRLSYRFGRNLFGSCGYIAIEMIMSYYDNYLNDNIVPEIYEVVSDNVNLSPGTCYDYITDEDLALSGKNRVEALTAYDYIKICRRKASANFETPSLHAKLISIGDELGYYDYNTGWDEEFKITTYPCSTNLDMQINLTKKYLSDLGYIEGIDFEIISSYSEPEISAEDFSKKYIASGYPVLINAYNIGEYYGHAAVGYRCKFNDLYVHMGYGADHDVKLKNHYEFIEDAMVVKFNMSHTHSNNYVINNKTYCYCTDEVEIYHKHTYSYEADTTTHTKTCSCGLVKTENHIYTYSLGSKVGHLAKCDCGYKKVEEHTWAFYTPSGSLLALLGVDEDFYVPLSATDRYVKCIYCDYVRKLNIGEVVPVVPWE